MKQVFWKACSGPPGALLTGFGCTSCFCWLRRISWGLLECWCDKHKTHIVFLDIIYNKATGFAIFPGLPGRDFISVSVWISCSMWCSEALSQILFRTTCLTPQVQYDKRSLHMALHRFQWAKLRVGRWWWSNLNLPTVLWSHLMSAASRQALNSRESPWVTTKGKVSEAQNVPNDKWQSETVKNRDSFPFTSLSGIKTKHPTTEHSCRVSELRLIIAFRFNPLILLSQWATFSNQCLYRCVFWSPHRCQLSWQNSQDGRQHRWDQVTLSTYSCQSNSWNK